jgi:membrane-bound serine protease (ClpP class)
MRILVPRIFGPIVLLLGTLLCLAGGAVAEPDAPGAELPRLAVQLSLDGVIGPASADYFVRGLTAAVEQGARLVILRIDTPGGLDTSMREIVRAILAAPIPVLGYVAPGGARAASAGTFILYACHQAAKAPPTNLGAATPVAIGGFPGQEPQPEGAGDGKKGETEARDGAPAGKGAGEFKALNDAIAYIRSLAELRDRNADWAESAVRDAASISAREALSQGVIDIVADSVTELLAQADGRTIKLGAGEVTLATQALVVEAIDPDLRTRVLAALTNPNLALILLMIGIYGLIFEFMNPGALYPGTIGAICLLVGLYALSALPLNYAGLALLVLGIALIVAEALTPSVGILGVGGVIAFLLGSILLIDTDEPAFAVSLPLAAGLAAATLGIALLAARLALKSWHRPQVSGVPQMLQARARVLDWNGTAGHVLVEGERWRATGASDLRPGQAVRILAIAGLTLTVAPEVE